MTTPRHLLTLNDLGADGLQRIIERALAAKQSPDTSRPLAGHTLAMLFEKASTRTRVSFEAGMTQLGGHAIFLAPEDTQIGRGESVGDTARALSGMVDAIMIRNHDHGVVQQFAEAADVPIINGLTKHTHPCQLLADLLTIAEHRGGLSGQTVAWIGDGNNMCRSYMTAARLAGFQLRIATPPGYAPDAEDLAVAGDAAVYCQSAAEAVRGADVVATDVWASMGDEAERQQRLEDFAAFQVTEPLMAEAKQDALFMHCLPAHRGEEVSAEVIDGPASVVWDEAENRLHAQKALLLELLGY